METLSLYLPVSGLEGTLLSFICWASRSTTLVLLEDYFGRLVRRTFEIVFLADVSSTLYRTKFILFCRRVARLETFYIIYFSLSVGVCALRMYQIRVMSRSLRLFTHGHFSPVLPPQSVEASCCILVCPHEMWPGWTCLLHFAWVLQWITFEMQETVVQTRSSRRGLVP